MENKNWPAGAMYRITRSDQEVRFCDVIPQSINDTFSGGTVAFYDQEASPDSIESKSGFIAEFREPFYPVPSELEWRPNWRLIEDKYRFATRNGFNLWVLHESNPHFDERLKLWFSEKAQKNMYPPDYINDNVFCDPILIKRPETDQDKISRLEHRIMVLEAIIYNVQKTMTEVGNLVNFPKP